MHLGRRWSQYQQCCAHRHNDGDIVDDDGDVATGDANADAVDQQARIPVRAAVVTAPADPAGPELVRAGHERRTALFFPAADASTTDDETARHQPSGTAERNASERARLPTRRREGQR